MSIKPGDLLVGLGDGEVGGKIFLVMEVDHPQTRGTAIILRDGEAVRESLAWLETLTQPLESLIETR